MKTAFITGGSGFVGRNLIRSLIDAGYAVTGLARSDASARMIQQLGALVVRGDVLDERALRQGMAGCGAMIHAAADTNHAAGADAAQERVNVEGTRTVFCAARNAGVQRALHISTESVLADGRPIRMADETAPYPRRHAGGYSRTKARAERAALEEARPGFSVCAIRPRFIWGRDDSTALPQLVEATRTGKLQWIAGGEYLTSTTHVDNVVVGAIAALERGRTGETYFLTDGAPLPFRTFVSELLRTQGVEPPTRSVPRWAVRALVGFGALVQRVSGGSIRPMMSAQEYATVAHEVTVNDTKARRELGYAPAMTIERGMAELRSRR